VSCLSTSFQWLREADEEDSDEESEDEAPPRAKAKAGAGQAKAAPAPKPVEHSEDEDENDADDVSDEKAKVNRADSPESRSPAGSPSGEHSKEPSSQKSKEGAGSPFQGGGEPGVKRDLSFQMQDLEDDEARRNGESTDEEEELLSELGSAGKHPGSLAKVAEEEERDAPNELPPNSIDYENDGKYLRGMSDEEEKREARQPIKHTPQDQPVGPPRRKSSEALPHHSRAEEPPRET
jgi:hypothetical protein